MVSLDLFDENCKTLSRVFQLSNDESLPPPTSSTHLESQGVDDQFKEEFEKEREEEQFDRRHVG